MHMDDLKGTIIELENLLCKGEKGVLYKTIIEAVEKPLIQYALERTEGNQLKAARNLGINRNTMRAKIKKFGINAEIYKQ